MSKLRRSFTLIEVIVVFFILAFVAGLIVTGIGMARGKSQEVACINNLKSIGLGLQLYFNDNVLYPETLDDIYPEYIASEKNFICPADPFRDETNRNSYDAFYVERDANTTSSAYVVGCPYHGSGAKSLNIFQDSRVEGLAQIEVNYMGSPIGPGDEMGTGTTTFGDGESTANVTGLGPGKAVLLQSFETKDGELYVVIEVTGEGKTVNCHVKDGTKFEVVTPAGIAGVFGTDFTITTSSANSGNVEVAINVSDGVVAMRRSIRATRRAAQGLTSQPIVLTEGESVNLISEPRCSRKHLPKAAKDSAEKFKWDKQQKKIKDSNPSSSNSSNNSSNRIIDKWTNKLKGSSSTTSSDDNSVDDYDSDAYDPVNDPTLSYNDDPADYDDPALYDDATSDDIYDGDPDSDENAEPDPYY